MYKLVLLRHGESQWNKKNRFTGWTDIDLSDNGILEAQKAGKMLKAKGYAFDIADTSVLKRAIRTLWIVLDNMNLMWIPVIKDWRLNERHYGALQGLNKTDTAKKYGDEQIHIWRRSYDIRPPALNASDERYPGNEPAYQKLPKENLPLTECLKDTLDRFFPYWKTSILPQIKENKDILIVAHGNTLRAIVKQLEHIADNQISQYNIPTGIPLILELNQSLNSIKHYYLWDPEKKDTP